MKPFFLALVCLLQIPSTAKAQTGDKIADFLLQKNSGGRVFASREANAGVLAAAVRAWRQQSEASLVQALENAVAPGSKGEAGLMRALSHWKGELRVRTSADAAAFLKDAADEVQKLTADAAPAVSAPDGQKSVERARALNGKGINVDPGMFGGERIDESFTPRAIVGGKFSKAKFPVAPPKSNAWKLRYDIHDVPSPHSDGKVRPAKFDVDAPGLDDPRKPDPSDGVKVPPVMATPEDPIVRPPVRL